MTQRPRKRRDSDKKIQKHLTSLTFIIMAVQFPIKKTKMTKTDSIIYKFIFNEA